MRFSLCTLQFALPFVMLATALWAAVPGRGQVGGPYKVIAADFTGDRIVDLAIGYHNIGVATIEQGNGKGQFSRISLVESTVPPPSQDSGVYNITHGDIDKDGLPDLAFSIQGSPAEGLDRSAKDIPLEVLKIFQQSWRGRIVIARNAGRERHGGRSLQKMAEFPVESAATGVALADLDKDGRLDLLYNARGSGYVGDIAMGRLLIRQGLDGWKFGPAHEFEAGPSAYFIETADLNNDGFLDIAVPNEHGVTVQYYINPGKKIFSEPRTLVHRVLVTTPIPGRRSHAVNNVRAADFNRDGNLDLVTANLGTSTISIFPGNGNGMFQKDTLLEAGLNGAFLGVGDLDKDGDADFVITHWTEDFLSVFLNKGNGEFNERKDYKTGSGNYGVTLGDVNNDGKLDAVTANYRERTISVLKGVGDGTFQTAVTTPKGLRLQDGKWIPE